jgi:hypothetical protein
MEQDDTLRIAVLDANPIGLEATLYARYLGYVVHTFAAEEVCAEVERLSSLALAGRFRQHCSPLGLAALDAHDSSYEHPTADQILTGRQWLDEYLLPLSRTDLIADSLRLRHTILAVEYADNDETFSVRVRDGADAERIETVDYLVDTRAQACIGLLDPKEASKKPATFAGCDAEDYFFVAAETFRDGLEQIRRIFAKVGERDELDIYLTLKRFEL